MKTKNLFKSKELLIINYALLIALSSCSVSKQIAKQANTILLSDTAISQGHIGISIYEPATGKYWYNYDATKYFVPASNTKLFTLYAGMKYLGDSLVGLRYQREKNILVIIPTGDPTFLNDEFKTQRVFDFLANEKYVLLAEEATETIWRSQPYGKGWAWDDFNESYMTERSCFPIYDNLVRIELTEDALKYKLSNTNYTENNRNYFNKR